MAMSDSRCPPPRWRIVLLFALVLMGIHSAIFWGGRTLLPIAPNYGIMPGVPYGYEGPVADSPVSIDFAGAYGECAFDAYTAGQLRQGTIPFWNPYQGLGQPFLANGLSAMFYPINWLWLVLPLAWWDMVYLCNWLLAAVFLYAYLQLMGLRVEAALIGGVAVLAGGFFHLYLPLREVIGVSAWWPLLLYGVERSIRTPTWRARHLVLALAVYCTITAGQPEVIFVSLCVTLSYALVRIATGPQSVWRSVLALAPGSLAGLLLAAPMWVNFVSHAFTAYAGLHHAGSTIGLAHLSFASIATYIFPYLYGRVQTAPLGEVAGWQWNYSPGWFPLMGLFLALLSLSTLLKKPAWGLGFLWVVAAGITAKMWGLPVVNALGRLPLFERVWFCRYAAFLLAFALAGLAAYGSDALSRLEARRWAPWLAAWFVLIVATFALGVSAVWPTLRQNTLSSLPVTTVGTFGGLGLAWAVLVPLGLWWVRYRRQEEAGWLSMVAAFGMLLQGVAYAPHGYTTRTYALLSLVCLLSYLLMAAVVGLAHRIRLPYVFAGGLVLIFGLPWLATALAPHGLAARYNPLTPAPYLTFLQGLQDGKPYRSYSFDGVPQPNFALPFGVASLNSIEALLLPASAEFMRSYLDRGTLPLFFASNLAAERNPDLPASDEFWANKRYFDFVGVRYVATRGTDLRPAFYNTEAFGLPRVPAPLSQPLEVIFPCPVDELSGIQVLLSTYQRKNPGRVTLSILDSDGALLGDKGVEGVDLLDNTFQEFSFPAIQGRKGQHLRLRLAFEPHQDGSVVAAWVYPERPALGFAFRILDPHALTLLYEDPETKVRVWENQTAIPRVFLAPTGSVASSWQEALARLPETPDLTRQVWIEPGPAVETSWPESQPTGRLLSFQLAPNDVWVRYQADTAGILTLTDSYAEGWHVELNGSPAPVLRVDGAFRGVHIEKPGVYDIHFCYRPPHWSLSLGLAGTGVLLLIGAGLVAGRRERVSGARAGDHDHSGVAAEAAAGRGGTAAAE